MALILNILTALLLYGLLSLVVIWFESGNVADTTTREDCYQKANWSWWVDLCDDKPTREESRMQERQKIMAERNISADDLPVISYWPDTGIREDANGCHTVGHVHNRVRIIGAAGQEIGSACITIPDSLLGDIDIFSNGAREVHLILKKYIPEEGTRGYWLFGFEGISEDGSRKTTYLFPYAYDYNKPDPAFPDVFRKVLSHPRRPAPQNMESSHGK